MRQRTQSCVALDETRLSRVAGLTPATLRSHDPKEPSPAQQADHSILKELNCAGIASLRGQGSNLGLLLQGQAWFRFHHLASVGLDGEARTPSPRLRKPARSLLRHVQSCPVTLTGRSFVRSC